MRRVEKGEGRNKIRFRGMGLMEARGRGWGGGVSIRRKKS